MSLTEAQIIELIAKGENEQIDFKQELNLGMASERAEFIKDTLSIVNSKTDVGYLLIGVDNSGSLVGISLLEEERIQQLLHGYISPSPTVNCSLLSLGNPTVQIGIIEIKGIDKPYKVSHSIDRLLQNDVFVRHGSVVVKASPEEIARMYDESRTFHERQRYLKTAEIALKLKDFQDATEAYTKAIKLLPTTDIFLERAKVYILQGEEALAVRDLSHAIDLLGPFKIQKDARLERTRVLLSDFGNDTFQEDLGWLKENTEGKVLGEVLLLEVKRMNEYSPLYSELNEYALSLLDTIIELGYDHVDVYIERLEAHFGAMNYGAVLNDVRKALTLTSDLEKIKRVLRMKVWTFSCVGDFKKYSDSVDEFTRIFGKRELNGWVKGIFGIEDEILCRCAIELEFPDSSDYNSKKILAFVQLLKSVMPNFQKRYPKLAAIIQDFLNSN